MTGLSMYVESAWVILQVQTILWERQSSAMVAVSRRSNEHRWTKPYYHKSHPRMLMADEVVGHQWEYSSRRDILTNRLSYLPRCSCKGLVGATWHPSIRSAKLIYTQHLQAVLTQERMAF